MRQTKLLKKRIVFCFITVFFTILAFFVPGVKSQTSKAGVKGNNTQKKEAVVYLKKDPSTPVKGIIVKANKKGILFDADKKSLLYDPKARYYPFSEIDKMVVAGKEISFHGSITKPEVSTLVRGKSKRRQLPATLLPFKLRLNAEYGYSQRTAKVSANVPDDYHDYMNELKTGINVSADAAFFLFHKYGLGVRYIRFSASILMDGIPVSDEEGTLLGTGAMEDNITISMVGPTLFGRMPLTRNLQFISGLTVGYISYQDDSSIFRVPFVIKGNTWGVGGSLGLDYFITKNIAIGINLSYLNGQLSEMKVNSETVSLDENEGLHRFDLNVGLKLYQ